MEEIKLLILRVTNDCNLRCCYCYACGGDNRDTMDLDTAKQAIDYVAVRNKSFKIQFTGGEPLLKFFLIKKIIEYTNSLSLSVRYQLQTNGVLITQKVARELKDMKIALGVSLDGMPDVNDSMRPFPNGSGSTLATLQGLQNLKSAGIKVGITAVITADCIAGLPRLVELASYQGNVHGIALDLLRPIGRCGKDIKLPKPEALVKQVRASLQRAEELARLGGNLVRFREIDRLRYQLRRGVMRNHYCYATTGQSMVVMPHGEVYPCSSLADIPDFYLGSIYDRDFSLASSVSRLPLLQRTVNDMASCRACPDNWLCGGGCLARTYAYSGRIDTVYPGDCQLKQVFLQYVREKEK